MDRSSEVESIFQALDTESRNLLINAAPGTGKTTVLCEVWKRSAQTPMAFLAFNVPIVQEIKTRLGETDKGQISTLHSLGYQALRSGLGYVEVDKYKVPKLIKKHLSSSWPMADRSNWSYDLSRLVSHMKGTGLVWLDYTEIHALRLEHDLTGYKGIEEDAIFIFNRSLEDKKTVDFDDQLLFPVALGLEMPQFELVLVDESQDVNGARRALLQSLNSRTICMGDPRQSIYAFAGALPNAMELLREDFNSLVFPMTITYRCSQSVVREAQQYYPDDIRAFPDNPEGRVQNGLFKESNWTHSDLVVCRNNQPLISLAYSLLRNNIPCQVRGRDIGKNLITYLKKFHLTSVNALYDAVQADIEHQCHLAQLNEEDDRIAQLQDKLGTVEAFIANYSGADCEGLYQSISALFENGKGVTLSTIHKAKGLEAQRVYFLDPQLCSPRIPRGKKAINPITAIQEKNLRYVAVTRAKEGLTYLKSGQFTI